ncbi:hypothetical protein SAMN02745248_02429 [Hathewaya proteolytica DSM 3090]|uniref:Uncharacterized protein n=1 Tax=Hathewaya proteolytica DSM 3090 TaxID=1121331 RepID=A0A1M6S252_9CLOT|nr:hypothetical protein [Hathewaya proteolytica]SHK38780.1 hypothetical protein SAMN02745248_02429 [Hathewaya proteolytica DSM 3090]
MKIIDKVLDENEYTEEDLIEWKCPYFYGFERPTIEECHSMTCEQCWNREVEE